MKKRGRPVTRVSKVFISKELMEKYFKKQIAYEDAVRLMTIDDCKNRVEVWPTNFDRKEVRQYYYGCDMLLGTNLKKAPKFFSMVDQCTGEIFFEKHYLPYDKVCVWAQNMNLIKLYAHY